MDERIEYFGLYRNVRDTQQRERERALERERKREREEQRQRDCRKSCLGLPKRHSKATCIKMKRPKSAEKF